MKLRFLIFFTIFFSVFGLSAFYLGLRLISWSHWAAEHQGTIWMGLSVFIFLQILGPYLYRAYPNHMNRLFILQWITYTAMGIFSCLFFYTIVADLVVVFWKMIFNHANQMDLQSYSLMTVGFFAIGSTIVGAIQVALGPKVYEVEIPLPGLPLEFEGMKVVQISDLHVGPTIGRRYVERVVNLVNGLAADLVVLTGDLIDGPVSHLQEEIGPLSRLKAAHGAYISTGNHEYYWGALNWVKKFQDLGFRVLLNEHVIISRGENRLVLAGVTDLTAGQMIREHASDPHEALRGAFDKDIKILLAHHSGSYKESVKAGVHLQISGHTHAGQFFPWSLLVRLFHRYYKGLNQHEGMWIYVSRGTGYWGPPMRFGVPAEVTLLTLRRSPI